MANFKGNFSPYAPRRRRSPLVVLTWVAVWLTVLTLTWWFTTGRSAGISAADREFADAVIKGKEIPPEAGA
ncbi:uncharacterized protein ColSpa_07100 [Colletotrichum spaethianum]|uniref:Uncharacterized protein n=1 Tax=Colletotrichum spaethianum TaxID=700344 RepID=A0AA37LIK3_9PEZI|nr:uncharacterized protein ColSpa_07100 [Colletotrichum spaethianum]GKT46919.1 hypothetical protein ColSpa_07100 [Colletotrichum spaethianum]